MHDLRVSTAMTVAMTMVVMGVTMAVVGVAVSTIRSSVAVTMTSSAVLKEEDTQEVNDQAKYWDDQESVVLDLKIIHVKTHLKSEFGDDTDLRWLNKPFNCFGKDEKWNEKKEESIDEASQNLNKDQPTLLTGQVRHENDSYLSSDVSIAKFFVRLPLCDHRCH